MNYLQLIKNNRVRVIFFKKFRLNLIMGIHKHEKEAPQPVELNIQLFLSDEVKVETDDINTTFNYDSIRNEILDLCKNNRFNLQETFCDEVMKICLKDEKIIATKISSQKTTVYQDCDGIGYEIFKIK